MAENLHHKYIHVSATADPSVCRNKSKVRERERACVPMHVCECVSSSEATAQYNGTKNLSITIKRKWKAVKRGRKGPLCVPNLWTGCGPWSAGGWGVEWDVSDLGNEA